MKNALAARPKFQYLYEPVVFERDLRVEVDDVELAFRGYLKPDGKLEDVVGLAMRSPRIGREGRELWNVPVVPLGRASLDPGDDRVDVLLG